MEEVVNFSGKVRREVADNVVESCLLCSDALCGELSFDLGEPDFRVSRQKSGSLMLTAATVGVGSADGRTAGGSESPTHSIMEGSVVAIVKDERELSIHQGRRRQGHQCCRFATVVTTVFNFIIKQLTDFAWNTCSLYTLYRLVSVKWYRIVCVCMTQSMV